MADQNGHIEKTLEELRLDLAGHLDEAQRILSTMNMLEAKIGVGLTTIADISLQTSGALSGKNAPPSSGTNSASPRRSNTPMRPDQYLGVTPLDAAKAYIGTVGHAVPVDEISDAISRGGAAIKGSDWRDKLEMSLIRSTYDVVKVQEHTFGLAAFYTEEQLRGLRGTRRSAEPKPQKKKRKKPTMKKVAAAVTPKVEKEEKAT